MKGLTYREQEIMEGTFSGTNDPGERAKGKELVKYYGIKVQQLADCSVCHY
jgi:hypothetical protein